MAEARPFTIAVDGPAASGKGTLSAGLARALELPHLDSGLLYRAVAHAAGPVFSEARAIAAARALDPNTFDNPALRTREIGEAASQVAAVPEVRAALLDFQRGFAEQPGGAVIDGRDIGAVIAPWAPAKLFVTAEPQVRARRRWLQLKDQGASFEAILADICLRDERDSSRAASPLVMADDAVLLDTTDMTIEQAADAARRIVETARGRWANTQAG